jgi:hypothetical protein
MATAFVVCIGNDLVANTNLKLLGVGGMSLLEEFQGEEHLKRLMF